MPESIVSRVLPGVRIHTCSINSGIGDEIDRRSTPIARCEGFLCIRLTMLEYPKLAITAEIEIGTQEPNPRIRPHIPGNKIRFVRNVCECSHLAGSEGNDGGHRVRYPGSSVQERPGSGFVQVVQFHGDDLTGRKVQDDRR